MALYSLLFCPVPWLGFCVVLTVISGDVAWHPLLLPFCLVKKKKGH
jgi:hypothetical protein